MLSIHRPYFPPAATIGICGTAANSGATHFSLALCSYLHGRYLARPAYLEVNASRAIGALSDQKDRTVPFVRRGIRFFPELTIRELPECLRIRSRYKVLDFGVLTPYTMQAFADCDLCVVLTGTSVWKSNQLARFLDEINHYKNYRKEKPTIHFYAFGGAEHDRKKLCRHLGIRIFPVPFLPDPFCVSHKDFTVFESLWT